jgi:hypothetical protein
LSAFSLKSRIQILIFLSFFLQWSSFTSNIVHRRLVDGHPPISIRFY